MHVIAGGRASDILPTGEYVVEFPGSDHLQTHLGEIPPPLDPTGTSYHVHYPRCTSRGGFRFAGQGQPGRTPEWTYSRGWDTHAQTACGAGGPVIYDAAGNLHISDCSMGTTGWRYVEPGTGRLISGDATYLPAPGTALFEWTDLGDGYLVGQGPGGGVGLWDPSVGVHRRIADGVCKIVRAHRDADNRVAISWWQEDRHAAVLHWTTLDALLTLSIVWPEASPFPAPLLFAPYHTHGTKYGVTSRFIGNVAFPDDVLHARTLPTTLPQICGFDTYDATLRDRYHYYYLHANPTVDAARPQFDFFQDKPRRDLIVYLDGRVWPATLPSWVPSWAILCGQAYLNPGESIALFESVMRDMLRQMARFGRPLALTTCHYDRNGAVSVDLVRQLTPVYDTLVREFALVGLLPFADMREGPQFPGGPIVGGMHRHPVLYDEAQALFDRIPAGALPTFAPPVVPVTPFFSRLEPFMAETRYVYLKAREYFIGVDPHHPEVVYSDRTVAGGWERAKLTKLSEEEYSVLFVDANRQFSQQPDGTYQTRPAGHVQSWERLRGGRLPSGVEILGAFVVVPA